MSRAAGGFGNSCHDAQRLPLAPLAEPAALLRVLADGNRLRIRGFLWQQETRVCDFVARIGLLQPPASRHLRVLGEAGLVRDRREAQWAYYSIHPKRMAGLSARLLGLLDASSLRSEAACGAAPHEC